MKDNSVKDHDQFDEDLTEYYLMNRPDQQLYDRKCYIFENFLRLVKERFPCYKLHVTGSTVTGCGSRESGLDLCLLSAKGRPGNKFYSTDKGFCNAKLLKVAKAIAVEGSRFGFLEPEHFSDAELPFVRFQAVDGDKMVRVKVYFNRTDAVRTSHLLYHYAKVDERFRMLCVLVRAWYKRNHPLRHSGALDFMVLNYLIRGTEQPVLPDLTEIYRPFFDAAWPTETLCMAEKLPWPLPDYRRNTASIGELMLGFFDYYATFDGSNITTCSHANSAREACQLSRPIGTEASGRNCVALPDPYSSLASSKAAARCVRTVIESAKSIREELVSATPPPSLAFFGLSLSDDESSESLIVGGLQKTAKAPHEHPFTPLDIARRDNVLLDRQGTQRSANKLELLPKLGCVHKEGLEKFGDELSRYYDVHRQDPRLFAVKISVAQKVQQVVRRLYPNCKVHVIGSTLNGCVSKDSDMDLCLAMKTQGFYSTRKANSKLAAAAEALEKTARFTDVQHINHAKVPIVRFTCIAGDRQINVDLNYNRIYGVYNTHLLSHYSKLDSRFPTLCIAIRGWANGEGILNARWKTFNSYTLNLLVLHYLVHAAEPPVLPDLQAAYPEFFGLGRPIERIYDNGALPWPLPVLPKNEQGVAELLAGFFMYFTSFNFASYAVSVSNGGCVQRTKLPAVMSLPDPGVHRNPIVVIDPYEPVNPARTINALSFPIVMTAFHAARDALCSIDVPPSLQRLGLDVHQQSDKDGKEALGG